MDLMGIVPRRPWYRRPWLWVGVGLAVTLAVVGASALLLA
jgi:hypothetical protein